MAHKAPTKKQREIVRQHIASPFILTGSDVMQRLKLKDRNDYYRLVTRCVIADRMDAIEQKSV